MRCPDCHHDNRSDRRFCTQCGAKLATGCPSCGAPIEVGEKFCGGCGAALTIGGGTTTPLLAEKIRRAKATIEGERKQVTVLFIDVKGSRADQTRASSDPGRPGAVRLRDGGPGERSRWPGGTGDGLPHGKVAGTPSRPREQP